MRELYQRICPAGLAADLLHERPDHESGGVRAAPRRELPGTTRGRRAEKLLLMRNALPYAENLFAYTESRDLVIRHGGGYVEKDVYASNTLKLTQEESRQPLGKVHGLLQHRREELLH